MLNEMKLEDLLLEVQRQVRVKTDYLTSTKQNIRMDGQRLAGETDPAYMNLQGEHDLIRLGITDHAHRQISDRLGIPLKYYLRLLEDHTDLVIDQVNALFEREPQSRMIRVLDGKVRAFLSNRYRRLDNDKVLEASLPAIVKGDLNCAPLSMNVDANNMTMKVLFLDESLEHEVAKVHGKPRIIKPGFRLSNSETGQGSLRIQMFFYDSYCTNGCVFGLKEAFTYSRNHIGGKLIEGAGIEIQSDKSRDLEDQTILSHIGDAMAALSDPKQVALMAEHLSSAYNSESVQEPLAAIDLAVKELDIKESEKASIIETFIRDADYSKFGLASAITEVANTSSFTRACEIEDIGAKVLDLTTSQWNRFVTAEFETVAA